MELEQLQSFEKLAIKKSIERGIWTSIEKDEHREGRASRGKSIERDEHWDKH